MKITREIDYALRILRELADGELHSVVEICEREQLPQAFAYKIIKKLQTKGYIIIVRGAKGGCKKGKPFSETSLYDIMCAVNSDNNIGRCVDSNFKCEWRNKNGACTIHNNLLCIQAKLNKEFQSYSIEQLLSEEI